MEVQRLVDLCDITGFDGFNIAYNKYIEPKYYVEIRDDNFEDRTGTCSNISWYDAITEDILNICNELHLLENSESYDQVAVRELLDAIEPKNTTNYVRNESGEFKAILPDSGNRYFSEEITQFLLNKEGKEQLNK